MMVLLLKAMKPGHLIVALFVLPGAPAFAQYGDGQKATMRDLGYYWKTVYDSAGNPQKKCFNVGNNQQTDHLRCVTAERMVREGYQPGD